MNEQSRLYCIFGYETQGGRKSPLWDNQRLFVMASGQGGKMLDEDYHEWMGTKRKFTESEITNGVWIKEGDHGLSFKVKFHADGRLVESNLSDDSKSWEGAWELVSGVLRTRVGDYELDILAKNEGNVHSGIEVKDNRPNAYFKMIHKDDDPLGIR